MPEGSNTSAAQVFAAAFRRHGVEVIFGQSIPSKFFLAIPEFGIDQLTYRTENAGAVMADAYARVSHKVGVVTAQNGPAATLLVAGLAEALTASSPVVALVQDTPPIFRDRNAFQELDHLELFKGCAKWVRRIEDVRRIDDYVDMAFRAAVSGRPGPVVLLSPVNIMEAEQAASSGRTENLGHVPLDRPVADHDLLGEAARLLDGARHPLVWAGGGVHMSDACASLAALQEECHLPVATTTMGKGAIDDGHPLSVGVIGYYMATGGATKFLRPMIDEADVILAVGNRTNQNGTDSWSLLPAGCRIVHIDIDPQEIGRNHEALRLVGDARATLDALRERLKTHDLTRRKEARPAVEARIAEGKARHWEEIAGISASSAGPVRPERLMAELDRVLTPEHIVVADASYASIWICNNLASRRAGQRFLTPRGMAGLGWGLPMAIGAKVARPDAPVFCLAGDGGFAHVWSELETARRLGTHVVLAVLNNEILGYQWHAEEARFGAHTSACQFTSVDHAAVADAAGCRGVRVESGDAFGPALEEAFAMTDRVTTVIDVMTDPAAHPPITAFEKARR
ncbi:MAG: acetolactate synthase catalytic subunit [Proteobacteria bacterium]|nr:acetolactate synthase catalytic subunit [Pseudomonadota bacterium]